MCMYTINEYEEEKRERERKKKKIEEWKNI